MKLLLAVTFACAVVHARAETPTETAIGLYSAGRYPEAEAALRQLVAADPKNAADCHYYGLVLRQLDGESHLIEAASWLEKAVKLDPDNAVEVYDYGRVCFRLAERRYSVFYALRGRDAMKRTIALDPGQLDARADLMEFYARAPWPLGSSSRALGQADEIGRRDRVRGVRAELRLAQIFEQKEDRSAARDACKAALELDPADAAAAAALARLGTL